MVSLDVNIPLFALSLRNSAAGLLCPHQRLRKFLESRAMKLTPCFHEYVNTLLEMDGYVLVFQLSPVIEEGVTSEREETINALMVSVFVCLIW